ncbi:MAG: MarR family winged helix-turn-helix transcriptional regulator [Acidimicrobiales bacterium]
MEKTCWLDEEEQKTWRSFLEATRLLWTRLEAQLQQDAGMPCSYYQVLAQLSEVPDRALRMSDLAEATSSSRSRLSHAMVAVLTPQGLAALEAAAPGHVAAVRESLFDALSPNQVRELGRIFRKVIATLEAARLRSPGVDRKSTPVRSRS